MRGAGAARWAKAFVPRWVDQYGLVERRIYWPNPGNQSVSRTGGLFRDAGRGNRMLYFTYQGILRHRKLVIFLTFAVNHFLAVVDQPGFPRDRIAQGMVRHASVLRLVH